MARCEDSTANGRPSTSQCGDTEAAYRAVPLPDRPGITGVLPSWRTWLERENDPRYWRGISYASRRAEATVPGLHVGP